MPAEQIRNDDLPHVLAQDTGHAEDQQRPRIVEHTLQQRPVETDPASGQFRQQAQQHHQRGDHVGHEDPADAERLAAQRHVEPRHQPRHRLHQRRTAQDEQQVQRDGQPHVQQFDSGETERLLLETQISERQVREGVDGHDHAQHPYIRPVVRQQHSVGHGMYQQRQQHHEQQRGGADGHQGRGVDLLRILRAVGEAEETGLHTVVQDHQGHGGEGVEVTDDTVLVRRENIYIERHEAPVQKPAHDAGEAIDGRLFSQGFYTGHETILNFECGILN